MPTFADFQNQVRLRLQDAATKLATADRDELIKQAITQQYSKDRPQEKVTDVAGNATADLAVPAGFEDGFSVIRSLEFPIGNVPADLIEDADWDFYRTPTALKVRLLSSTPAASENVRITWTQRHLSDATTIPAWDFEAIADYAAGMGFEALAAVYAQTGDASIGADAVNYRTKAQEYMSLGKALKKRYYNHVGIDEDKAAAAGPVISTGEVDQELGTAQVDRLTHPKRTR